MAFFADTHSVAGHGERPSLLARLFRASADFFDTYRAAVRIAAAVESHRNPDERDLMVLGIENSFPRIRR